jgi:hypothetical protein
LIINGKQLHSKNFLFAPCLNPDYQNLLPQTSWHNEYM